jgi:hypothetical protein
VCKADPAVATYCNEAQDRLLMDPMAPDEGWWGGWVTLNLSATVICQAAYVTTPHEIARLIVMDVCNHPVRIRNGFYEYLEFGRGLRPKRCAQGCGDAFQAYERDSVVTLAPMLSTPQVIRIYPTDARDAGFLVLIQGKDQNGQAVLTTDPNTGTAAPGEYISLKFPFADSVNTYLGSLSGIQKDQTYGPLQFFQVDPITGAEAALSAMEPNEMVANYRRYLIAGIPNANLCCFSPSNPLTITAQGRLEFVPVENETDYLTLQNVPALVEEAQSIRFSKMDSTSAASQANYHHARALALLNGQLDKYEGKISTAVNVPIWGSNRMRRQLF